MSQDTGRTPEQIAEAIALRVLVASASDSAGLDRIRCLLAELRQALDAGPGASLASRVDDCLGLLDAARGAAPDQARTLLRSLAETFAALQGALLAQGTGPATPPDCLDGNAFELPSWVDEATFREFLAGQQGALEDIEAWALAMDAGRAGNSAQLKRKIHTLKGEAGIVGLDDLERVYHTVEDLIERSIPVQDKVDRLLALKDWLGQALAAYASKRHPTPGATWIIGILEGTAGAAETAPASDATAGAAASTPVSPDPRHSATPQAAEAVSIDIALPPPSGHIVVDGPPAVATPEQPPSSPAPKDAQPSVASGPPGDEPCVRDEETIALIAEFLTESTEGIAGVDQILMNTEQDGFNADMVNSIFRTFHSIKGVAGFLDLQDIQALAHTTEALLNLVRQGKLELKGAALDRVFDATEAMRAMLEGVRQAVDAQRAIPPNPALPGLLDRLQAVIDGRAEKPDPVPEVEPGLKLGEVLQRITRIPPEIIDKAVEQQRSSGRRLGEELVAQGIVKPREVVTALRAQAASGGGKIKETIKVDLERLDSLVEMIGELVIVESMVMNIPEIQQIQSHMARNYLGQLTKITRDLQSVGMRMRMVPVRSAFQKMARLVRDLSHKSGKQVKITLAGEATEMDRTMVDQVADPLVHMVRNAIDHGLEPPEEREKRGKSPVGELRLSAYHEGGSILIELSDDGRGLDREAILNKARSQGIVREGQTLSDAEIYDLIFAPGFSTARQVTEISGRGVGMDVVKRNIEAMRGRVLISTEKGKGTTFKLVLPLTLAIIDGMLVASGSERYIIPTLSIVESIQPRRDMLFALADRHEVINVRGEILPLLRLDQLFQIDDAKKDPTEGLVVVVETVGKKMGLVVDDVVAQQQVVIKSLGTGMSQTRLVSGAAILSDGRVGLIVNVDEIGAMIDRNRRVRQEEVPAGYEWQMSRAAAEGASDAALD